MHQNIMGFHRGLKTVEAQLLKEESLFLEIFMIYSYFLSEFFLGRKMIIDCGDIHLADSARSRGSEAPSNPFSAKRYRCFPNALAGIHFFRV